MIRLLIKGDARVAAAAAAKFGVAMTSITPNDWRECYADTDASALPNVIKWYLSTLGHDGAGFADGTLLFYSQKDAGGYDLQLSY
jgi:hypothetical protein